ncbi:hypothetical protein DL98DRAFT_532622 [Cadophora sp. DSE1049]|nr:hypothetical protein DL98DRAFT_532622 [Cadophora sp. DSE1049]
MAISTQDPASTPLPPAHSSPLKTSTTHTTEPPKPSLSSSHPQPKPKPHFPSDCTICHSPFNTPRPDGTTETPSLLPCAHIFGSICIKRWLESSQHQNCPNCRREMRYSGCGHAVVPKALPRTMPRALELEAQEDVDVDADVNVESESELKAVKMEDMPSLCLLCRESREMEEVVKMAERRLVAEERALEGLRALPGLFGGLYKGSESASGAGSLGERSGEVRERWRSEMEVLREGLRGRMEGREEWLTCVEVEEEEPGLRLGTGIGIIPLNMAFGALGCSGNGRSRNGNWYLIAGVF